MKHRISIWRAYAFARITGAQKRRLTGVNSTALERHLQEVDRDIAESDERIIRQQAIIIELEARGDDASSAKELLQTLEEAQGLLLAGRTRIAKELTALQAAGT